MKAKFPDPLPIRDLLRLENKMRKPLKMLGKTVSDILKRVKLTLWPQYNKMAWAPAHGRPMTMKKILVVEDELSIANFITDMIQMLGYDSKVLTSGTHVLSTAKEWRPDLITLDIMMPSPDGLEVLQLLKTDPDTAHTPIFIISVIASNKEVAEKLKQAQGVFKKPLDTKHFIREVRKAFGQE